MAATNNTSASSNAVVLYLPKPGVLVLKIPTMAAAKTSITPSGI